MRQHRVSLALAGLLILPVWASAAEDKPDPATAKVPRCEATTGSRIAPKPDDTGKCPTLAGPGEVYDREDLERTGEIDLGRALSRLSPSIGRSP